MADSNVWSMDRVAADALAASLGVGFTEQQVDAIAGHFARHRSRSCEWATERAHINILEALESASRELLHDSSDEWTEGFHRAEQVVMALSSDELLCVTPRAERTRGQYLRAMVRKAKTARTP